MIQSRAYHEEPIVDLANPWGESAVATIRTSGKGALYLIASAFSRTEALQGAASHSLVHGLLVAGRADERSTRFSVRSFERGGATREKSRWSSMPTAVFP